MEFTRERKSMGTVYQAVHGTQRVLLVKGAPESVLARCNGVRDGRGLIHDMKPQTRAQVRSRSARAQWRCKEHARPCAQILERVAGIAATGLRTLALAYTENIV